MSLNCGIVGLPNVGKSTLFNALIQKAGAEVANYPFCTIEPNAGRIAVPDPRLDQILRLSKSPRATPTFLEFVDIAGLVKGASKGEGLGNQFLANIREVDAIVHVLRCFEDDNILHSEVNIDPVRDAEVVGTELLLADLESLERRIEPIGKKARGGDKDAKARLAAVEPILEALREGRSARTVPVPPEHRREVRNLQLLTTKPVLYACNVDEGAAADGNTHTQAVARLAEAEGAESVIISAKIEAEVAQLTDETERREFLETLGLEETGLARVISAGYRLLNLITFFTTGPKETRAWTVVEGSKAPRAAGAIHTDFERGFICAETISFEDFVTQGGEQGAREAGKMRQEGRDYVVRDGDVILFRFNV